MPRQHKRHWPGSYSRHSASLGTLRLVVLCPARVAVSIRLWSSRTSRNVVDTVAIRTAALARGWRGARVRRVSQTGTEGHIICAWPTGPQAITLMPTETTMRNAALAAKLSTVNDVDMPALEALEHEIMTEFDVIDAESKTAAAVDELKELVVAHDDVTRAMGSFSLHERKAALAARPSVQAESAAAFNAASGGAPLLPRGNEGALGRGVLTDRYGKTIDDARALAQTLTAAFGQATKESSRVPVLSATWMDAYPDERRLTGDPVSDTAKMDAQHAVVASGGICSAVSVDFSIDTIAIDARPLRSGLPGFEASRGGVRFVPPVALASTAGATSIWTEAIDANPGTATKAQLSITCPDEQEVLVDAIATRIRVGNMMGRFHPEMVENFTSTAFAAAARVAEINLLTKISSYSTPVSSGQLLGASRDFIATVEQATAAYRYRQRTGDQMGMTICIPSWTMNLVRADLARELAHDDQGSDPLAVTDARIASWFAVRRLTPIWILDGAPAVTGGSGQVPYAFQGFGAQAPGTALVDWPHTMTWWLWADGAFQFLDGGRLDVGVIRDSTLNATNDYELMVETFENVLYRGVEALQVTSTIRPNGASAAGVNTSTY